MSKCKWVLLGIGIAAAGYLILRKTGMLKLKYINVYDDEDDFYEGDINYCCCGEKPDAVIKTPEKEDTSAGIEIEVKPPVDDIT
ncbi:MAG: hypothetical protein GX942_08850 [Papillibacter sp.]|jgi:hypothetical protein|nr:hypothetical protein [Papillibacter sp.]